MRLFWQEGLSDLQNLKLLGLQKLKSASLLDVFTHAGSLFASAGKVNAESIFQKYAFQLPHFA